MIQALTRLLMRMPLKPAAVFAIVLGCALLFGVAEAKSPAFYVPEDQRGEPMSPASLFILIIGAVIAVFWAARR